MAEIGQRTQGPAWARPSSARLVATVVIFELASGLPFGVVNELVPVWLRERGVDLGTLGVLSLLGLPWTFKALWAPLVDRYFGLRVWMMAGLATVVACLLVLAALVSPVSVPLDLVVLTLLVLAMGSATQDIAIDGYIANAVPPEQHGRANGVRVAAYRAAMALAGGGAVVVGDRYGWDYGFLSLALFGALLLPGLWTAPRAPAPPSDSLRVWLRALYGWVGDPAATALIFLALVYKLGDAAIAPMVKPFWLDMGMSASEVGMFSTTFGAALTAVGALAGGELITRIGLYRAFLPLALVQALSNLAYTGAALWPGVQTVYGASVVESLSAGLGTAALMAAFTRGATGAQAATRFAILAAVAGLTRVLAGAVSGFGADSFGYAGWFTLTVALALPGLLVGPYVCKKLS